VKRITKTRKKTHRNWTKIVGISLFVIVIGTLITFSALPRILQPHPPPKPASEYFSFTDVIAIATPQDPQNRTIFVDKVVFNITAVGGDATDVLIRPLQGLVKEEDYPYFGKLTQGTPTTLADLIDYPNNVFCTYNQTANGWPLLFHIYSDEAEGDVVIYATQFFSP